MKTVHFNGRRAMPLNICAGVEMDNGVEQIQFILPQIAEGQTETLYWSIGNYDGSLILDNGLWTVYDTFTQFPGQHECYISISDGDIILWHSEEFIANVADLPNKNTGGIANYDNLYNKPKINDVELSGDKSLSDIGAAALDDIPTKVSDLTDDSGHYTKPATGIPDSDIESSATWNAKYDKPSGGIPASDLASDVIPDTTGKADKVSSATEGHFAALDASGNLTDSGHTHSDYLTEHQDISGKLDAPETEGAIGQVPRLASGGGMEWATVGQPTDEQTAQAVYDWLDDHPEATTTVEDGSITKAKLDSSLQEIVDDVPELKSAFDAIDAVSEQTESFTDAGYYLDTSGVRKSGGLNYKSTDFIEIIGNELRYKLYFATVMGTICFYSSAAQNSFISAIVGESAGVQEGTITEFPTGAKYIRACYFTNNTYPENVYYLRQGKIISVSDLKNQLDDAEIEVAELSASVDENEAALTNKLDAYVEIAKPYPNSGYLKANGVPSSGASTYTDYIPIEDSVTSIDYYLAHVTGGLMIAFYSDENATFISGVEGTGDNKTMNKGSATIPEGAKYFRAAQWTISGVNDYYVRKRYTIDSIVNRIHDTEATAKANQANIKTEQLMESINKPFDFSSKKITAFGDSITAGVGSPNLQSVTSYIKNFADHVGATLTNRAVSGQVIASDGQYSIYTRVTTYSETTDFIVIAGGTNDFNTNVELGTFASTAGTDTFYGALKGICEFLAEDYPDTPVIWITPIPYTNRDPNTPNTAGYTLNQYRQAIYEIGTLYGHSVVNGAGLGMPTKQGGWNNAMCDDTDGCHPTAEGHKLYARSLAGKLC